MYKIVVAIDAVSHKIFDPWLNNQWPGWREVLKWQNFLCNSLDRFYV